MAKKGKGGNHPGDNHAPANYHPPHGLDIQLEDDGAKVCPHCKGTGQISPEEQAETSRQVNFWATCAPPFQPRSSGGWG